MGGSKGAAGLASGLPVLAEALEALDATIEPGMRFTALYPARIDPHLPPSEPRLACFVVTRAPGCEHPARITGAAWLPICPAATADTIPSLLQSGKLPHEREEEAECVREAAAAGELPKEGVSSPAGELAHRRRNRR